MWKAVKWTRTDTLSSKRRSKKEWKQKKVPPAAWLEICAGCYDKSNVCHCTQNNWWILNGRLESCPNLQRLGSVVINSTLSTERGFLVINILSLPYHTAAAHGCHTHIKFTTSSRASGRAKSRANSVAMIVHVHFHFARQLSWPDKGLVEIASQRWSCIRSGLWKLHAWQYSVACQHSLSMAQHFLRKMSHISRNPGPHQYQFQKHVLKLALQTDRRNCTIVCVHSLAGLGLASSRDAVHLVENH